MSVVERSTASFTEGLRREADPVFGAIFDHPFVRGIAAGDVGRERLAHYVRQDHQYLTVLCQVYGLAISKCEDREDIAFFNEQIGFVLDDESHPHRNLAAVSGYPMEELEGGTISPRAPSPTPATCSTRRTRGPLANSCAPCSRAR